MLQNHKMPFSLCGYTGYEVIKTNKKKKDIEAISYESVGGHGCSCLVTYGKYLGLAGFWKDERFLFAHHHTGNGFFYYFFLLPGNNGELVWVDFLGELMRRRSVQIDWGKRLCPFVLCVFFTAYNNFCPPPWRRRRVDSVLSGSSFRCSDNTRALCYWIFSSGKDKCVWSCFIILLRSILEWMGGAMTWSGLRVGFSGFSGPFFGTPWCCNFMGNLSVSGFFIWRMCVV